MNQIISLILAGTCTLSAGSVPASLAPPQSRVHINVTLDEGSPAFTSADIAKFTLSDGENTYSEEVLISDVPKQFTISFAVSEYTLGKEFTLTPVSGIQSILYNEKEYTAGQSITIPTAYVENENGEFSSINSAQMTYKPIVSNAVTTYLNNEVLQYPVPATVIDGVVMLPIEKTAEYMKIPVYFDSTTNSYTLSNKDGYLRLYIDNVYTVAKTDFNAPVAPTYIDGVAFASAEVIADAFGAPIEITQSNKGYAVSMHYTAPVEPPVVTAYINNKQMQFPVPATVIDGVVMLPIEKTAEYMHIPVKFDSTKKSYTLSNKHGYLGLFMNSVYTATKQDYNAPVAPTYIDGVAFASAKVITDAFGATLNITQNDNKYNVSITYTPPQTSEETYVNNAKLSSKTSYLIWVSKKNFRVHVFMGEKGNWTLLKSLKCSIGAPSTPTCEGTYRYYESIKKWDYGSYYVGPVMRFNGGYALHSTIINNNGTLRDGRLEKMISHGCVRIAPSDMNWLFATVPLYTTVHVTGY